MYVSPTEASVGRPSVRVEIGDDVRWSAPGSWHVTIRFLGEIDDPTTAEAALAAVEPTPTVAVIRCAPERVGPTAIALPVDGLDDLAAAVARAFAGLPGTERRPFRGHLTIGRLRHPARWPANGVAPLPTEVRWEVGSLALVCSHLGAGPAEYETLARCWFA